MRWYLGLMSLGLVIAAIVGMPLAWDGSYVLFKTLDAQTAFEPHYRLPNIPFHMFVVLVSRVTDNFDVLRATFGLVHAVIPVLALAAAWWVARDTMPHLFVWAAFGIGLATLPGQIVFISESVKAVQLFWPILLAVLAHMPRAKLPVVIPIIAAVFYYHPISTALLIIASVVALLLWFTYGDEGNRMLWWSAGFAGLAVVRFLMIEPGYEREELSLVRMGGMFQVAVAGLPLAALVCAWVAGLLVFARPLVPARSRTVRAVLTVLAGTGILAAGGILVVWASDPHLWWKAIDYRWWASVLSLPFLGMAVYEGVAGRTRLLRDPTRLLRHRLRVVQLIGVAFVAVLAVQSAAFAGLVNQFSRELAQNPSACITPTSLMSIKRTVFDHWSVGTEAVMLQSRAPQRLVLADDGCAQARSAGAVRIVGWDPQSEGDQWMRVQQTRTRLADSERCWHMASGWYQLEQRDRDWWQWSGGRGAIRVAMAQETTATLQGGLFSLERPNRVDVLVNGVLQRTLENTRGEFQPFEVPALRLKAGMNLIEMVSRNPGVTPPGESRSLAMAVGNVRLTTDNAVPACQPR